MTHQNVETVVGHLDHSRSSNAAPSQRLIPTSQRLLGSYYTPDTLADILTRWALAPRLGTILDPSFGQGAFLKAAARVLVDKGIQEPGSLIFGVDVDPSCVAHVSDDSKLLKENCLIRDFLSLSPNDLPNAPFHAVVGNPPYVRHHWFSGATREAGRAAMDKAGIALPSTASTWAYFLIHALSFIAKHRRLAMLVPEAILQADYSVSVRNVLAARFEHVRLVHVRRRLFDDTDEAVVVVAASEYGKQGSLCVRSVERTESLPRALSTERSRRAPSVHRITPNGRPVDSAVMELLAELEKHSAVRRVTDLATVRVGLVTGANSHFIRNVAELKRLGIPRQVCLPIISRTRWLSGLDFTYNELQELIETGQRAVLVRPTSAYENVSGVHRWIAEGLKAHVHEGFKCRTRTPWYQVPLPPAPDAFATCARLGSPLLVVNQAKSHCTNALHAVYWKVGAGVPLKRAAVGALTSAVGVWAELRGRRYGGGVLKMEPSIFSKAPIPLVQNAENDFGAIDKLMREGQEDAARRLADDTVLVFGLGLSTRDVGRLQRAGEQLKEHRRPIRSE